MDIDGLKIERILRTKFPEHDVQVEPLEQLAEGVTTIVRVDGKPVRITFPNSVAKALRDVHGLDVAEEMSLIAVTEVRADLGLDPNYN